MASPYDQLPWPPPEWGVPATAPPIDPNAGALGPVPGLPDMSGQISAGPPPPALGSPASLNAAIASAPPQPGMALQGTSDMVTQRAAPPSFEQWMGLGGGGVGGGADMTKKGQQVVAKQAAQAADPYNQERTGLAAQGQIETAANTADAQGKQQTADLYAQRLKMEDDQRAQHQALAQQHFTEMQGDLDDLKNAKIDPSHYWGNLSGLGKVVSAAAILVGGWQAPSNGGRNFALETINQNIDRDIAAQRDNLANKRASVEAKNSLYGQMLKEYGDEDVATHMATAALIDQSKMAIEAQVAGIKSPEPLARAQIGIGQLGQRQQQEMAAAADRKASLGIQAAGLAQAAKFHAEDQKESARRFDISTGMEQQRYGAQQAAAAAQQQKEEMKDQRERGIHDASGKLLGTVDDSGVKALAVEQWIPKYQQYKDTTTKLAAAAKELEQEARNHPANYTQSDAYARANQLRAELSQQSRDLHEMGVFREADAGPLAALTGSDADKDPMWFMRSQNKATWQTGLDLARGGINAKMHGIGLDTDFDPAPKPVPPLEQFGGKTKGLIAPRDQPAGLAAHVAGLPESPEEAQQRAERAAYEARQRQSRK